MKFQEYENQLSSLTPSELSLAVTPVPLESPENGSVTLAWKELSVYVPLPKLGFFKAQPRHRPIKRVINNSAGIVTPGSLLAIMVRNFPIFYLLHKNDPKNS